MRIFCHSLMGYKGDLILVEIDIRKSMPGFELVGLASSSIKEARERVRSALKNSMYEFPLGRVIINLAPADIKKQGNSFDLPIALSILLKSRLPEDIFNSNYDIMVLGELQLDGSVRSINGVIAAIVSGKEAGIENFIIPKDNMAEASAIEGIKIWGVGNLKEAFEISFDIACGGDVESHKHKDSGDIFEDDEDLDFRDIRGQAILRRALEVSAVGGHNVLLFGPPGGGKTMISRRLKTILPKLDEQEAIEVSSIWSISGKDTRDYVVMKKRPFRSPHHSASLEGLIGGGANIYPGEVSLAHHGILFLDEAPEFKKNILQSLREPIEDREVTISRAGKTYTFPANFQLILAMNPCPCGNMGKNSTACFCSDAEVKNYWKKLGGALLDRIDIRIPVEPVDVKTLTGEKNEDSKAVLSRVLKAREMQLKRYQGTSFKKNSDLYGDYISQYCHINELVREKFITITSKLSLSGRALHGILKVARSIADLNLSQDIKEEHVLEAIHYRRYGDGDFYWN